MYLRNHYRKKVCVYIIFIMLLFSGCLAQGESLSALSVEANTAELSCYSLLELTPDIGAAYENPFNPEEIDVHALFTHESGAEVRVNGFYTQPCDRRMENQNESIIPVGKAGWRIRFTPSLAGRWQYYVQATDRTGSLCSSVAAFTVTPSAHPGFIRKNKDNPFLFAYDSGRPFFAIGENMCWGSGRGTRSYDDWLPALGKAGGNWIRIWMVPWTEGIEWISDGQAEWNPSRFGGLGRYNLANAWKLDYILEAAGKQGIQVMLCLGTYGEFTTGGYFNEGLWNANPFNAANGGPCEKAADFWTNEQARKHYRNRLRYITARYGAHTNVFAWEFWNEARAPAAWIAEMSACIKGTAGQPPLDPYMHLLSTTYGNEDVWKLPTVDFTMTHYYGEGNVTTVQSVVREDAHWHRKFNKPHLMAEFGLDWRSSDEKYDKTFQGVNLHNALWSSLASGNGGTAMIWYWDSYIHPGNLYTQYTSIRKFSDLVPWKEGVWLPLDLPVPQAAADPGTFHDLVVAATGGWEANPVKDYEIDPVEGAQGKTLPKFLFGPWKAELRVPLVLKVAFEQPGRFEMRISDVSSLAQLEFQLDGMPVQTHRLSALPQGPDNPNPEYASTRLRPEYNSYQAVFQKWYGLAVPAGSHTITVDATDGDWAGVEEYAFRDYVSDRFLNTFCAGLSNGTSALLWILNPEHHWKNVAEGTAIVPIPESILTIPGMADGSYTCEFWDTWNGVPARHAEVSSSDSLMTVTMPDIDKDLAVLIRKE